MTAISLMSLYDQHLQEVQENLDTGVRETKAISADNLTLSKSISLITLCG